MSSDKQKRVELSLSQMYKFCLDVQEAKRTFGGRDNFVLNRVYQNAVLYSLEQIGESASRIDLWLIREMPEIPWKNVIGFRVNAAHRYHHMDFASAWITIENDIPDLIRALENIGPVVVSEDEIIQSPNRLKQSSEQ